MIVATGSILFSVQFCKLSGDREEICFIAQCSMLMHVMLPEKLASIRIQIQIG